MPQPHYYKHLDKEKSCNVNIEMDMEQLAKKVCGVNYGLHRFLSEVIDIKRESVWAKDITFADELERLLLENHD